MKEARKRRETGKRAEEKRKEEKGKAREVKLLRA